MLTKTNVMDNIGKACYAMIDSGLFGVRVVAGVITGIRYTESDPLYCIQMGKDLWWSKDIFFLRENVADYIALADLDRVQQSHGLMIKYAK